MSRVEHTSDGAIYTDATRYEVSCLPLDHNSRRHFTVAVEYRGHNSWAVLDGMRHCMGRDGKWDYESLPSNREEEWTATHRFPLLEALELARRVAPTMQIMGRGVAWALAHPDWH